MPAQPRASQSASCVSQLTELKGNACLRPNAALRQPCLQCYPYNLWPHSACMSTSGNLLQGGPCCSASQSVAMLAILKSGARRRSEVVERRTSNSCMRILSVTPRTSTADQGSSKLYMLFRKSAMEEHSAISSADMSNEPCKHSVHLSFTAAKTPDEGCPVCLCAHSKAPRQPSLNSVLIYYDMSEG